jgi:hypothetical protein
LLLKQSGYSRCLYIVAFIVALLLTIALTAVAWGIKRIFFRRANHFTILAFVSIIFGVILGVFATFIVPQFESVYQSFGAEIPMPTGIVLRFRALLWLPLLLTAISLCRLRVQTAHLRYYLFGVMSETMLLLLVLMILYALIIKFGCVY